MGCIKRDLEDEIIDKMDEVKDIRRIIDMSDRCIPGIAIFPSYELTAEASLAKVYDEERKANCLITLGFAEEASLGLSSSTFYNSFYNKDLYEKCVHEAEMELEEVINKFAILGTYTRDVYEAQKRLSSIKMKMATIYVGGDSDISRNLLKDSVEDSIRAAESAFQNGYVQGCNFTLINCIKELIEKDQKSGNDDYIRRELLNALLEAFKSVYREVLNNAFGRDDKIMLTSIDDILNEMTDRGVKVYRSDISEALGSCEVGSSCLFSDIIIKISEYCGQVLNLDRMEFSNDVINSAKTDIEILTATSDLLSMLMVGNQVVMASYNHMKHM